MYRRSVDGGTPLHHRSVQGDLVDALAQANGVGRRRILIRDGNQWRAIEEGVGDAVDHVGRTWPPGRQANAWRTRNLAPGGREHGACDFLLHQDETHVALAQRFHQFDGLPARMAGNERRAGLLDGIGNDFHRR